MKQYIVLTAETAEELAAQVEQKMTVDSYVPQGGVSCSHSVWTEENHRDGGYVVMERTLYAQAMVPRFPGVF